MLQTKLRLDYALVVGSEDAYIKENYDYLTLHCGLGVNTKGHLISYLNIKNPNCGKG